MINIPAVEIWDVLMDMARTGRIELEVAHDETTYRVRTASPSAKDH
jgi:hypothetical protein